MRALAEWVMRGRTQAITATVLSASIPLLFLLVEVTNARLILGLVATVLMTLSAAIVGLVTLRRSTSDGVGLMLWTLLPALVWLVWRDEASPLVTLLGTTALAVVLKQTVSWSKTLSVATVVALLISFLIDKLLPGTVTQVTEAAAMLIEMIGEANPEVAQMLDVNWLRELMLGVVVASYLGTVLTSLAISRWWQSMLYNPGGFKAEFHGLRLPPLFAAVGLIVLVLANSLPGEMVRWLPVMITPFMMASIALIHGTVAKRGLSRSWLIAFYVVMFIAGPYLIALLIMLAVADSFIDIRRRLTARP
ncbi:MAG: hypothetical protein V7752_07510 [Halopseudomonas sp.]